MTAPFRSPAIGSDEAPEARAARLNAELRDADAEAILATALHREFPGRIASVSSFGAESSVLLSLIAEVDRETPILFIDTGMHFAQTEQYRRSLAKALGLSNVRDIRPSQEDLAAHDPKNDLHKTDTDGCCRIRKVRPLDATLSSFDAWITGRKRFHGGERWRLPVVEATGRQLKFNPLANWTADDLAAYAARRNLPRHPMVDMGYASIGCWPCTSPTKSGEDARAGRWRGQDKTECGIHTPFVSDGGGI